MASKKRPIQKPTDLTHELAISKVLKFFNDVKNAEEIVEVIRDDPTFGKSNEAYGIRRPVANKILQTRAKLPGNKFTEINQINKVHGVGSDTINDIFYSFFSDIVNERRGIEKPSKIILDFVYENNLLYVVIENMGDTVTNRVSIDFDKKIMGLGKEKNISEMQIFKTISVFPPKKRFKIFVDTFSSYVKNKQPLLLTSKITYYQNNKRFEDIIKHDLRIYKDFVETLNSDDMYEKSG